MPTYTVAQVDGSRILTRQSVVTDTGRRGAVSLASLVTENDLELVDCGFCAESNGEPAARLATPANRQYLVWKTADEPMVRGPMVPLNAY